MLMHTPWMNRALRWRRKLGGHAMRLFFEGSARAFRLHPRAEPSRHRVELLRDLPYRRTGRREHRLDIYRSTHHRSPQPVVLYLHGGAFRILSKDTHWVMGLAFAREGYLTVLPSYRLAPAHPFPAAVQDAAAAYAWVREYAARYGGDPQRLVVAGESAGANLATALTVAACFPRESALARQVWEVGPPPRAALPACGLLQVSDPERFRRHRPDLGRFAFDRIREASRGYLPVDPESLPPGVRDLVDPLLLLESEELPARPLPPFFTGVGTADPLLPDTRRLAAALQRRGVPCEAHYYSREMHAFHAFVFREAARQYWRAQYAFLRRHLADDPTSRGEHPAQTP
jgi:acetyl esterase